jgi:hypothetical protein
LSKRSATRGCRLALVDQPAAEHHQVDAQAEVVEFQQEVLAPAAHGPHPAAVHARQRLAGVAADSRTVQPVNRPAASRSSTIDGPSGMAPTARPGSRSVRR